MAKGKSNKHELASPAQENQIVPGRQVRKRNFRCMRRLVETSFQELQYWLHSNHDVAVCVI